MTGLGLKDFCTLMLCLCPQSTVSLQGAGTLQQVTVPIISQSSCQSMYNTNPSEPVDIINDMICAGHQEGGKDSCQVGIGQDMEFMFSGCASRMFGWSYRYLFL